MSNEETAPSNSGDELAIIQEARRLADKTLHVLGGDSALPAAFREQVRLHNEGTAARIHQAQGAAQAAAAIAREYKALIPRDEVVALPSVERAVLDLARLAEGQASLLQLQLEQDREALAESIRLRAALEGGQDQSARATRTLNRLTAVLVALTALAAIGAIPVIIDGLRWLRLAT